MDCPNGEVAHLVEVLGEADTRDLVTLYLEQTRMELERLAIIAADRQLVKVHGLKGTSYQVGAHEFARACAAVETRLKSRPGPVDDEDLQELLAAFERAASGLRAWVAAFA
jgi:HPt (histidine-containing phosphotransfer) domain-containing protein